MTKKAKKKRLPSRSQFNWHPLLSAPLVFFSALAKNTSIPVCFVVFRFRIFRLHNKRSFLLRTRRPKLLLLINFISLWLRGTEQNRTDRKPTHFLASPSPSPTSSRKMKTNCPKSVLTFAIPLVENLKDPASDYFAFPSTN